MNYEQLVNLFEKEFSWVKNEFNTINLTIGQAYDSKDLRVTQPGVYVWLMRDEVLKVGRHLQNSRKRALEHIRDNTGKIMGRLKEDLSVSLVLFNVKNQEKIHWVVALEVYFEITLNPKIRSNRIG